MTQFVLHSVPGSPFLRAAMIVLEEKGAAYRVAALSPGSMGTPEYRALHPFGRMPVLEHGDYKLYETQAILRYVDALIPSPALTPSEPQAIGRMNQFIGINDWYLFPQVARVIVFQRLIGPALMGLQPDEAAIAAAVPDAKICLAELNRLLGDQQFLAGDAFTLADALLAPQLDYLAMTPEGASLMEGTALHAWLMRMRERPSLRKTAPPQALSSAA